MNTEINFSDATRLAELIRNREVSPVEVVPSCRRTSIASKPLTRRSTRSLRFGLRGRSPMQRPRKPIF
jgi:hypothetical protein